jgi:hypothetical protein
MAQRIKQGNIFGRVGTGIGRGLAEQAPKEIEHHRLRTGLQSLADKADQGNLSPAQFLAQAAGTYGATPQMIQSFGELAKQQNRGNAYRNSAGGQSPPNASANIRPSQEAQLLDQEINDQQQPQNNFNPGQPQRQMPTRPDQGITSNGQRTPNVQPGEQTPEIANQNPTRKEAEPRGPWTPQQRDARIVHYLDQNYLPEEAKSQAADDEARFREGPKAEQDRDEYLKTQSQEARDELTRQLETKLQKQGNDVFKDVIGEYRTDMEKGIERDLRLNPKLSVKKAADDWSNRALNVAKAKNEVKELAKTTGSEIIWNGKAADVLNDLRSASDFFKDFGNSEEYYNILRKEFELSKQGAAIIAFPATQKVNEYVKSFKPTSVWFKNTDATSVPQQIESSARKAAVEIGQRINSNDSILGIARMLNERDPNFDQRAFFAQLNEDKSKLPLNDRQRREVAQSSRDIIPAWGDIKIFPWNRRSTP